MAVPRIVAGIAAQPANAVLSRLQDRKPVSTENLRHLVGSRERALSWHETGRMWTDLALARVLVAEGQPIIRADRDLAPAREALLRGLALAPANPYGWMRLAALELTLDGASPRVARLVQMSILTGPAERPLVFPRLGIALAVWDHATADERELVQTQLRWAWRAEPRRTAATVRKANAESALWSALAGSPDDLQAARLMLGANS